MFWEILISNLITASFVGSWLLTYHWYCEYKKLAYIVETVKTSYMKVIEMYFSYLQNVDFVALLKPFFTQPQQLNNPYVPVHLPMHAPNYNNIHEYKNSYNDDLDSLDGNEKMCPVGSEGYCPMGNKYNYKCPIGDSLYKNYPMCYKCPNDSMMNKCPGWSKPDTDKDNDNKNKTSEFTKDYEIKI